MKKFFAEFKAFALKGNVINLAVGVMIGAAFQSVVISLTENIISPIIGLFGGINFDALSWTLPGSQAVLAYGAFITALISFLMTAMVVFLMVKAMNRLLEGAKKPEEVPAPAPATQVCPYCKSEIDAAATRCKFCTSQLEAA